MKRLIGKKTRMIWGLVMILSVLFSIFLILPPLERQLVFPGQRTQGNGDVSIDANDPTDRLIPLTTRSGEKTFFRFVAAKTPDGRPDSAFQKRPTLIFFYGNGGCLAWTNSIFQNFRTLGINVVVPEYIGYGIAPGRPSEQNCYETAFAVYDYLTAEMKCDPKTIVSSGHSLGTGVACELARRKKVGGLVLFSGFSSLADAGSRLYPFLPVRLLARSRFANDEKIAEIDCPLLFVHGDRDGVVPIDLMRKNEKIAIEAGIPVSTLVLEGTDHDVFDDPDDFAKILEAVRQFIESHHLFNEGK